MSKNNILVIILLFFVLSKNVYPQHQSTEGNVYFGIGTGLSTFVGGEFGHRFEMRITLPDYYGNNYYNGYGHNYYGGYGYYDNYYDDYTSLYPLQADFVMGVRTSKHLSVELISGVIWHYNGVPSPEYTNGRYGGDNYTDRYANGNYLGIPVMLSLKYYPFVSQNVPLYISGGYGVQYVTESVDRVRDFYTYDPYYGGSVYSYGYPIAHYYDEKWIHGFRTALGYSFRMGNAMFGDVEFTYSNFFSSTLPYSPLAMDRTSNIGNLSLGTHFYFGFQ